MNIIQGLQMQGLTLNTQENFNSIPGLFLELNGQERKQNRIFAGNGVEMLSTWSSKKEPFYQFLGNNAYSVSFPRINSFSTNKGVKTIPFQPDPQGIIYGGGMSKGGITNDLLFLKNGAFGIYSISRHWKSTVAGGETNATSIIEFGAFGASSSSFVINNTCNGVQGGIRLTYSNSGATTYNATTVLNNNDNPMNQINSLGFLYRGSGVTDNYSLKINNVQKITTTHNMNLQLPVATMRVGFLQNTRDANVELMLLLVYNWNGVPQNVIDQYDARVREQLEQFKLTLL